MLRLYLQAPFAACRTFTAGWFRPTAAFLTPSAVYGLLLNVARIESRLTEEDPRHDGRVPTTLTQAGLPGCRIALGVPHGADLPRVQSLFQQLHNYPVGRDAGMPPETAMGNKNNITPVRREVLVGVRAVVAVDGNEDFEQRIRQGLRGDLNEGRYGLPFLGDNSFLPDRVELVERPGAVRWYERVEALENGPKAGVTRLTVKIDRADLSQTVSRLFAPAEAAEVDAPDAAWVEITAT